MYYIFFFFLVIINFLVDVRYRKLFLKLSFFLLFLFSAFRYDFGNDYLSYLSYYQNVRSGVSDVSIVESGFYYLCLIFPSFNLMLAFLSLIFFLVIYTLIKKTLTPNLYPFALLILLIDPYLFLMSLSAIRQTVAALIFMVAVFFALKKKYIIYFLLCLFAFVFHASAIILFPIIFVINDRRNLVFNKIFLLIFVALIFALYNLILDPLAIKVLKLFNNSNYLFYYKNFQTNSLRATILSSVSFLYVLINYDKQEKEDIVYTKLTLLFFLCDILSYKIPLMGRVGKYFSLFSIIALTKIFYMNYKNSKNMDRVINVYLLPFLILVIYLLRIYSFLTNPLWAKFSDYQTIFGNFW